MKKHTPKLLWAILIIFVSGAILRFYWEPEFAYIPPRDQVLNPAFRGEKPAYDVWGRSISAEEAAKLKKTDKGRKKLSPEQGAVPINPDTLNLGRKTFYQETFGNEVFLTDILGLVDGAVTIPNIMKAIWKLKGRGTTNLRVELAKTVTVGGKTFKKGTLIDTGIDVPKGAYMPLGMPVKFSGGRLKVGISCAACHATVDRESKKVVEGASNWDLNQGLLLALATNSSAYFTHTQLTKSQLNGLKRHLDRSGNSDPSQIAKALPDPKAMEDQVDRVLLRWPKGHFDSTIDLVSNPTKIPDSFTRGAHPYGWSGFAAAGPFKGLSTFSNNVHAQNSDPLSQAEVSRPLFGIDKEVYLGTILQNASNPKYRYHPGKGRNPSDFFASVDPTPGVTGINENISPPTFPRLTPVAPDGVFVSSPGYKAWEQINAVAAWQNTLVPPKAPIALDPKRVEQGKRVFQRAGCIRCHAGSAFTNNRIIPANVIGTEPSRAKALKKTGAIFGPPVIYSPDTPVPVPGKARTLRVPMEHLDAAQLKLGFAHGDSPGGYKVPSLKGLYWRVPYLHDGGVAAGRNPEELGVAGTLLRGIRPDPVRSLTALLDRELREKVIRANRSSERLRRVHVAGVGHEFWVDSANGFSKEEQRALIEYLLSLDGTSEQGGG